MAREEMVRSKFGLSKIVPYLRDEEPLSRHRRRWEAAVARREVVAAWCEYRTVSFRVVVNPHPAEHAWKSEVWMFRLPDGFACWRVSQARLTLKRPFRGGAHHWMKCYDTDQLLTALESWWSSEPRGSKEGA